MRKAKSDDELLAELRAFVHDEQEAAQDHLHDIWRRPLAEKLAHGWSQAFVRLERGETPNTVRACLDDGESRFREGDLLRLHGGNPREPLCSRLSLELEAEDHWVLQAPHGLAPLWGDYAGGPCYADPDALDLTSFYTEALDEIARSRIGREVVLPLLSGALKISFDERDVAEGERIALAEECNASQAQAVGVAYGAEQIACIQGPPGTGKTQVLALVVRLMVARGERVFVTSHTHTAINNALNKIHALGVPTVKVGLHAQRKGLHGEIQCVSAFINWSACPKNGGYVVGATPFATCSPRLENCKFDVVVFDEASQVTVPLALMAMRKGDRFVFVGDQKQLPPVVLSRSVLSKDSYSAFAALTSRAADHTVMLNETYRMNRWLTEWPSRMHYGSELRSLGRNRERQLTLSRVPPYLARAFDPTASAVFIPTLDRSARTRNYRDAALVTELCEAAVAGGLDLAAIGIVAPFRAHGRAVRDALKQRFGQTAARQVVADTVERMQGQEREMVIVSLATGDAGFLGCIADFLLQPERLNVAITRAMTKLIVIGPEPSQFPVLEDRRIQVWVDQYRDMIGHCLKVVL